VLSAARDPRGPGAPGKISSPVHLAADDVSEAFNPYREWLGLRADIDAPDYYQLLGLDRFENDRTRLTTAADRALARVRGFRPGVHAAAWARLLDELASAKSCFSDPERKSAYDNRLRQSGSRAQTVESPSHPQLHVAPGSASPDLYPPGMAPTGVDSMPNGMSPVLEGIPAATHARARPPAVPPPAGIQAASQVPASKAVTESERSTVREPVPPGPINAHVAPPREEKTSLLPLTAIVASVVVVLTAIVLAIALRDDAGGSALVPRDPRPPSPVAGSPSDENAQRLAPIGPASTSHPATSIDSQRAPDAPIPMASAR
jgi:hypothetical protein